jgi:Gly-Xaa carboxypeptidase
MAGPEDPRFEVMKGLHEYLEKTFPRVYETLDVEKVATYGILATWKGSNEKLKPVVCLSASFLAFPLLRCLPSTTSTQVLMAHQDTVPVPDSTLSRWTHPPFDAHLDSEGWIWGRGTADCKNTLVALLSTVDKLVEDGWEPTRCVSLLGRAILLVPPSFFSCTFFPPLLAPRTMPFSAGAFHPMFYPD